MAKILPLKCLTNAENFKRKNIFTLGHFPLPLDDLLLISDLDRLWSWDGELGLNPQHEKRLRREYHLKGKGSFFDLFDAFSFLKGGGDNPEKIRYLLRNKDAQTWWTIPRSGELINENWHTGATTKVLIHGFCPTIQHTAEFHLENQLIFPIAHEYKKGSMKINVIVVDWSEFACVVPWRYYKAAESIKTVGEDIAKFLLRLKNNGHIFSWSLVHIVGYSLGGHVSGVVGHVVQQLTGEKIGRISGLDPAGPNFDEGGNLPKDTSKVLDMSDAQFVDVIHTNMGSTFSSLLGRFGTTVKSGHADFYPNGGETQPGCGYYSDRTSACSHAHCLKYWLESIKTINYSCNACDDWQTYLKGLCGANDVANMGENCSPDANGNYYCSIPA